MADPVTLALVAGVAGAGTSAIGSIMGGNAKGAAAAYSAQVASNNAEIARRNAEYSEKAGVAQAQVDVQASERELGKLDTETVLNNAMLQNYGYRSQATNYEAQSGLDTMEAKEAPVAGELGAAGSLLGSASSLGLKWSSLGTGGGGG